MGSKIQLRSTLISRLDLRHCRNFPVPPRSCVARTDAAPNTNCVCAYGEKEEKVIRTKYARSFVSCTPYPEGRCWREGVIMLVVGAHSAKFPFSHLDVGESCRIIVDPCPREVFMSTRNPRDCLALPPPHEKRHHEILQGSSFCYTPAPGEVTSTQQTHDHHRSSIGRLLLVMHHAANTATAPSS